MSKSSLIHYCPAMDPSDIWKAFSMRLKDGISRFIREVGALIRCQ